MGPHTFPASTLQELKCDYLTAKSPLQSHHLKTILSLTNGKSVFELTLGNNVSSFKPPIQYRISFVTFVIKKLEDKTKFLDSEYVDQEENAEILEEWYICLEELSNESTLTEPFYRLYSISEIEEIIIKIFENEGAFVSEGTTGLVTWEASLHFVKWFRNQSPEKLKLNWALELGCGTGFLGISVLKLFPRLKYIATDGSTLALQKCEENFMTNFEEVIPVSLVETLDWTDTEKFYRIVEEYTKEHGTGYLFGADIVFDPELISPLLNLIQKFRTVQNQIPTPGKTILSCTVRNEQTIQTLQTQLENTSSETRTPNVVYSWENGFILEID